MAKVEMDLQELKAIENKVEEVREQAKVEKKELQDKIDKLQKEKETFIQNQKRVMFTKKIFDVKQSASFCHRGFWLARLAALAGLS